MNAAAADIPMATSEETVNTVSPVRVMARSPFRPTTDDNTGTETRRSGPFGERGVFPGQRWKTRTEAVSGVRGVNLPGGPPRRPVPPKRLAGSCAKVEARVSERRREVVGGAHRRGSVDLRILATTVKFESTTLAISYSVACPMNACAPRSVNP